MTIKFRIYCHACDCSFEIDSEHFFNRDDLTCPNCHQLFPQAQFLPIKQTMDSLRSISEVCAASSKEKGFRISISSVENTAELF